MISYLKGNLEYILNDYIIIEVNNIGYQVFVSPYTISLLPKNGNHLKLFTYLAVKEDAVLLYGFITLEELNMFNILIGVSGIGSKVALGMLSFMRPNDINMAIITEDIGSLSKIPGIGKKTSQRIILDLKDKLKVNSMFTSNNDTEIICENTLNICKQEAIEALMSLGYSQMESAKIVIDVYKEGMKVEEIIKLSLKKLAKF